MHEMTKMREQDWYLSAFQRGELGKYKNKWIAVLNNSVVASGDNLTDVKEKVGESHPNAMPYYAFIP